MRVAESFMEMVLQQKRIKVTNDQEMEYRKDNADFWHTFDQLNQRERFTSVLSNGYDVKQYRIPNYFQGLIFPSEVTLLPGNKYMDYLDRTYSLYDGDVNLGEYSPTLLTPEQMIDRFLSIVRILKLTPNSDIFVDYSSEAKTIASGNVYQFNGKTDATEIGTVFPVPVTIGISTTRYCVLDVDDDFVRDWLIFNFTSKALTR